MTGRPGVKGTSAVDGPPSFEEGQKTLKEHMPFRNPHPDVLYGGGNKNASPIPMDSNLRKWKNAERKETFNGTFKLFPGWWDPAWEPPLLKFVRGANPRMKSLAYRLIKWGNKFTSQFPKEELYRLRRLVTFHGKHPNVRDNAFVAPSAVVIGDVTVGRKSTVGYNAIVRGDLGHVEIAESATVNDKVVVIGPSFIGKWSTVDPMCIVDQAVVHPCSFIGSGTILGRGVVVESGSMVCSASVVNPGTIVPSGEIWSGQPAMFVGKISEEEQEYIVKAAKHMVLINLEHNDAWEITWEDLEDIRIGREWWAIWAQGMYEMRVKPMFVRDSPRPNRQTGRLAGSPCERYEGRLGADWEGISVPYNMPKNW